VAFDSNILISALMFPGKQAEKAILRIVENRDQLLISKPIIDEVLDVLARKFAREPEELSRVAVFLADLADMVQPRRRIRVLKDDADKRSVTAYLGECNHVCQGSEREPAFSRVQSELRIL
jgi:predicted nucleic acid-binding protein